VSRNTEGEGGRESGMGRERGRHCTWAEVGWQKEVASRQATRESLSGQENLAARQTHSGRNPGRSWLAETGRQAERDRLTCSSRQGLTGEGRGGTKVGRQNQKESSLVTPLYEAKHVGDKVISSRRVCTLVVYLV
jgi:hypothetical protein